MLVEILLLLFFAISIFHYKTRYGRVAKLVKDIPGMPALPLIGNLLSFMTKSQEELWLFSRKLNNDYYPIFKVWTSHEIIINLRHPDDVEILLSSTQHIDKSTAYSMLRPWLKTGLLTSTGNKWQKRRKILTPAFHFNVLQKYVDIIVENSEKLIKSLKIKCETDPASNLSQLSINHTLNVICEAAMGTSLSVTNEKQDKYRHAIHKMGEIIIYRLSRPWLRPDRIFNLSRTGREQNALLNVLHGFSKKIIKERKEYHEKTEDYYLNQLRFDETIDKKDDVSISEIRKKRLAMLDLLIASSRNNQIDDDGIQEEVDTFMFEGHDTVAMGLCYALLLLAEHKDIQARARDEVNEVLKKSDGKMSCSEIQQLQYLEMCIKESLRLYPSVPFMSRKLKQDLQLKNYLIPAGAIVHVHIYDLHRDANFWTEPDKFDPDRFIPDIIKYRHPFSYIPFSAGPRNCIGQKFAMMEMKATIAYLLHNFIFEAIDYAHEVPIISDLVLRPAHPLKMKLIPIEI